MGGSKSLNSSFFRCWFIVTGSIVISREEQLLDAAMRAVLSDRQIPRSMEVGKLNMLKASYLSQKYALEDMVLKKYPEAITRLTERIAGYEQDAQLSAAHPKPQEGFAGITILEQPYAEKEAAGKAILPQPV